MKQKLTILGGIAIWFAIGAVTWFFWLEQSNERVGQVADELIQQATGQRQEVFMYMEKSLVVGVGDPVFIETEDGRYEQVGEVAAIPAEVPLRYGTYDRVKTGRLMLYSKLGPIGEDASLTLYETPESAAWVLETMLPPAKQRQIASRISRAFDAHHQEIIAEMQPIIESGLRDAVVIVEEDLEDAILARSRRLEQIGAKYQSDIVEREVLPLVREEIFPIVRRYGEPLAEEIGREIWDEASLWRFGWRYMYDISPLPQRDLAKREFNRFVNSEAIPILEDHIDDFVAMQQDVFRDVARNPAVQNVVRRSLREIVEDEEVQRLMLEIVREVFIDNPRLKSVLREHWTSPEATRALRITSRRLEPTAVEIGELLFGSPELGITEEFSRVLRNQVLKKDRRWIVLNVGQLPASEDVPDHLVLEVNQGPRSTANPFTMTASMLP